MKYLLQGLKWLVFGILDLAFNLLCVLAFNWWVIFFAVDMKPDSWMYKDEDPKWRGLTKRLPRWLQWFETFDASLDEGWTGGYFAPKGTYSPDSMPSYWKRKYYQWR